MVEPLGRDRFAEAGVVLARAFHDDPIQVALVPDPVRRRRALPALFAAVVRTTAVAGGHLTAAADLAGIAVWQPPGVRVDLRAQARTGFSMVRAGLRMPWSAWRSLGEWGAVLGRRADLVPELHWYLETIGVDPDRHGRGIGTALVSEGLARADADGTRAYLETETEGNVAFYRRFGFEVVERIDPARLGTPMWLMVRPVA